MLIITTQSKAPPAGVFKSELDIARQVRDGKAKIDPLCALFNAIKLMEVGPVAAAPVSSPWDDPEFTMVA